MKFAKYQANNLVPEWRRKYLDVRDPFSIDLILCSIRKERNYLKRSREQDRVRRLHRLVQASDPLMEMRPIAKTHPVLLDPRLMVPLVQGAPIFDNDPL